VGAGRLIYLQKAVISYANELLGSTGGHLLQETLDFFCKRAPGDPQAHLLKKKFVISYANELQSVPKQKSRISYANEVLGIPRLTYLKRSVTSYEDEYPQAHLLEEISGFLGK
jgi:hypothetical protein